MKITKISEDNAGYKLIAAEHIAVNPGRAVVKQVSIGHTLFDYKDGVLREFHGLTIKEYITGSFKAALKLIFMMGYQGYNCAVNVLYKYGHRLDARMKLSENNHPVS